MADAYYLGDRGVEVDYEKAIAAFERDIDFSGRRCSMRRMGEICYFGKGVEVDLQKVTINSAALLGVCPDRI